jgi:hypothetical protein
MITLQQGTIYLGTAAPASGGGGSTTAISVENKNTAVGATNPLNFWEGTLEEYNTGGGSQTWYNWETNVTALWQSGGSLPSSGNWSNIAYGDGKFVVVAGRSSRSDKAAYSTDGINWTASTLPSLANWQSITYGDDKFVAVGSSNRALAYSTDGINWTASTSPSYGSWYSVTYGDGKFVAIAYGLDRAAYSTDGINWTASTLPSSDNWQSITYGDGKFVVIAYGLDIALYSTDGINWTASTLPSSESWYSVTYGDGKFVAVVTNGSNKAAYSIDGINWTASTLPSSAGWQSVTYGDGKFIAVTYSSDASAIFIISYDKCYTLDQTPTTASTVYSEPSVTSALTITSVGTGTITLSDLNTYDYNASGNQTTTQSVGEAYPDWICLIEGVGIKKGSTTIASIAPTVDQTYNAASTNAQSGVAVASGIADSLGTINTQLESIIAQGD